MFGKRDKQRRERDFNASTLHKNFKNGHDISMNIDTEHSEDAQNFGRRGRLWSVDGRTWGSRSSRTAADLPALADEPSEKENVN